MQNKAYRNYYLFAVVALLLASFYPLLMGVRVISEMIANGAVAKENYPKYIIPYTPISIALLFGLLIMPLMNKWLQKYALAGGAFLATAVFFVIELLFERKVIVSTAETVTVLENWQMYMCYIPPEGWGETVVSYKTQTAVDILMGAYDPAFKLHFYMISLVLILSILNCLYGFGQMLRNGEKHRLRSLILQSVCTVIFLGLCILACFTAFWRDGSLQVSALSASLMAIYFILLGVTTGAFAGSFLMRKSQFLSIWLPSILASLMTLAMYVGEMILLNGHLYSLGSGFFFETLPGIILAPMDLLIILTSGMVTAALLTLLRRSTNAAKGKSRIFLAIGIVLALVGLLIVLFIRYRHTLSDVSRNLISEDQKSTYSKVEILSEKSDSAGSSYEVLTQLPMTDFSGVSQVLTQRIEKEWNTYDAMTREQRLASSKLWGMVGIQADTWSECEEILGASVPNPVENLDWLSKVSCFGMEIIDEETTGKHILIQANTMPSPENPDRQINEIQVISGYTAEYAKVTLNITLSADTGLYTQQYADEGYVTYKHSYMTTAGSIPVLIVTADKTNNTGYYEDAFFDASAYWARNNVLYSLRVYGASTHRYEIESLLDRILTEIF